LIKLLNILKVSQALVMVWLIPYVYHQVNPSIDDWWNFSFLFTLGLAAVVSYSYAFFGLIRLFEGK